MIPRPSLAPRTALRLLALAALVALCAAPASAQPDHPVLVKVLPQVRTGLQVGSPFIAVANPTAAAVDLSDVYLSTAEDSPLGKNYWRIVTGQDAGGGTGGNFHVRFPQGMSLAPGDTVVIALAGSEAFADATDGYGFEPDLELFEDGTEPDAIPEMRAAHPGGLNWGLGSDPDTQNEPQMSLTADSVILYRWDGTSDLVQDLDYMAFGASTGVRVDKTGVTVDGPDGDGTASAYLADTAVASQSPVVGGSLQLGRALYRTGPDEIGETQTGGNGVTGHDETSETLASSWTTSTDATAPAAPADWYVTAPIVLAATSGSAVAGSPVSVQAEVVASDGVQGVTFHHRIEPDGVWNDVAGTASGDVWSAQLPAQAEGVTVSWYLTATGTGGGQADWPAGGAMYARSVTFAAPGEGATKLLLTEISTVGTSQEYIEIVNPSAEDVDLSDYYLSDAIYATGDQFYWRIAEGSPSQETAGGGAFGDFHARFPDGFTVAAGDTIVVSVAGSEAFASSFGYLPALELFEDGAEPDAVPDMRPIFGDPDGFNSIVGDGSLPGLSNASESVVLYYWDGVSVLVTDIDIFFWGTNENYRFSKTGVTVGGSTYQDETLVADQFPFAAEATFGESYQRVDATEGDQPGPPGNGVDGRDEVGEDLTSTFALLPYSPAVNLPDVPVIDAAGPTGVPLSGQPIPFTISVLAAQDLVQVTVEYALDGGAFQSAAAAEAGGIWEATLPAQPAGTIVTWYATATDIDGDGATYPIGAPDQTGSFTVVAEVAGPVKLLLSEISVIGTDQEYVEIANPSDQAVDLSDYYLTDAIYADGDQYYWRIAEGDPSQATIGGGAFGDWHARFPAGYTLAAGDTIVVSMAGSNAFTGAFGFPPHLELYEDGAEPDAVPDMRPVFGEPGGNNSIVGEGSTPGLSNGSETVVLYYWDGFSDLVTDIDIFFWGDDPRWRFSKTGVTVGGSTYQNETAVANQRPIVSAPDFGSSYQRTDPTEGDQPGPPGNGVDGRDEVGEDFASTFTIAPYDPKPNVQEGVFVLGSYVGPAYGGQPASLYVGVSEPAAVDSVVLNWSLLPEGDFTPVEGVAYGETGFAAQIPAQAAGDTVAWYWRLVDDQGNVTLYPAGGAGAAKTTVFEPVPEEAPVHLLLTEVSVGGSGRQFLEVQNPTDQTVALDDYYLSDAIYAPNNQFYWNLARYGFAIGDSLASDANASEIGGGGYGDWHGRFPAGAVIEPDQVITIAVNGSLAFVNAYGFLPDYELYEDSSRPDEVPDFRWVFGDAESNSIAGDYGSSFSYPDLDDRGESVVLYHWDGVTGHRVTDIDVFMWGDDENTRFSKNLLSVGDVTYGPETPVGRQRPTLDTAGDGSYQRVEPDEVGEIQLGVGNGTHGHDETSEHFGESWNVQPPNPGSPSDRVEGRVGEAALKVPARTFIPTLGERIEIRFTTRSQSETQLRILDLEGRLVITLYDSRFDGPASVNPGQYTVKGWDGRDETFERVKAGMYVVHLQVVDRQTGDKETRTAPVVVATRLGN